MLIERKYSYCALEPIYFYKNGDFCEDSEAGGWAPLLEKNARLINYPTYTNLYSTTTGYNNYGMFYTTKTINFPILVKNGYTKLCIEANVVRFGSSKLNVHIDPSATWGGGSYKWFITIDKEQKFTYTKNISDIPISYIFFIASYYNSINIYNVYVN